MLFFKNFPRSIFSLKFINHLKTKRTRKIGGTRLVPFSFLNTENNKSFQKQKPNRPLVFFENCYYSLNLLFFVFPIIFITIKRKGNHMFFKSKRKRNQKCSPYFLEQKTIFKTISN